MIIHPSRLCDSLIELANGEEGPVLLVGQLGAWGLGKLAVGPAIESDAQAALGIFEQVFGIRLTHPGKIINIELTFAAKAFAVVPEHIVPVCLARACDLDVIQRTLRS